MTKAHNHTNPSREQAGNGLPLEWIINIATVLAVGKLYRKQSRRNFITSAISSRLKLPKYFSYQYHRWRRTWNIQNESTSHLICDINDRDVRKNTFLTWSWLYNGLWWLRSDLAVLIRVQNYLTWIWSFWMSKLKIN